jgi:low temperature requirement protein LtrA
VTTQDHTATAAPTEVGPSSSAPTVGFLELFYDLIFVASTMALSNAFTLELSWHWGGICALMFAMVWMLWFQTTTLMNAERSEDMGHRALVLLQMLLISLVTLTFVDDDVTHGQYLGLAYAGALFVVAAMHERAARTAPHLARWARIRRNRLLAAAVATFLAFTWIPDGVDLVVFGFAILLMVLPSGIGVRDRSSFPTVDTHHLLERGALLTLIMCGEAFVKVALVVSQGVITDADVVAIVVQFLVIFALWTVYFDDIPKAGLRPGALAAEVWVLLHLPLHIGIVSVAVGVSKFLQLDEHGVHEEVTALLGVGFTLVYGALGLIGLLGERRPIGPLTIARFGLAATAAVLALACAVVAWFTPTQLLIALAVMALAHAVAADRLRAATHVPALH